jgi:hypothetical protein
MSPLSAAVMVPWIMRSCFLSKEPLIIHQLTELQADAASVDKLHERGSEILLGCKVVEFAVEGAEASMVTIVMEHSETRQRRTLSVQRVLIN